MSSVVVDGYAYFDFETKQPELRFTPGGSAVLTFSLAFWQGKDKDKGYVDVTCWNELAENVASSIKNGQSVVVSGRLSHRKWENNDGEKRSKLEITAHDVGGSMRWNTLEIHDTERNDTPSRPSAPPPNIPDEAPF